MKLWTSRIVIVAVGLLIALSGQSVFAQSDEQKELIGKAAPNVKGTFALNGKPTSVSKLKGNVVLVDFWAVWCGPCIRTFPHLREWHEKFGDKGLKVVGVTNYYKSYDFDADNGRLKRVVSFKLNKETKKREPVGKPLSTEQENAMLKKFANHYKLDYLLMAMPRADWTKQVSQGYHVRGIPTAVLIDRKGVVRMIRVGSGQANADALEEMIEELLEE